MSKQNSNLFPMPPKLPAFPVQPERDNRGKELDDLDELDAQATGEELTPDIEAEEPEAESASGTEEPQSTPVIPKPIRVPIRVPIMPALGTASAYDQWQLACRLVALRWREWLSGRGSYEAYEVALDFEDDTARDLENE